MEQAMGPASRTVGSNALRARLSFVMTALVAVAGCSPLRVAEAILLRDHFIRAENVSYGEGARERLDVYHARAAAELSPVVVYLYGGRWQNGSKNRYPLLGDALTRRGLVLVVPDYRLYPEVEFPGWVEDAARAVQWTRENIQRFGGDPGRIWVVGHSAGGHTAALLALDERYLRAAGVSTGTVRGFVSLAGPVDSEWTAADVQALMGPREGWPATYPATHIDGTERPLLLLHGSDDRTVSPANSVGLAERIVERGGCARSVVYPGIGHVEIAVALAVPRLRGPPVLENVLEFMREVEAGRCPGN
jgi:acetyl esterase/lipase